MPRASGVRATHATDDALINRICAAPQFESFRHLIIQFGQLSAGYASVVRLVSSALTCQSLAAVAVS